MTYSWSLSWANVDKAFYVEQETKAGFWNQDIQVFLIKEYIQGLCMSLGDLRQPLSGQSKSNPESWHRGLGRFLQPVGTWQVLKQRISIIQMFYQDAQEGWGKVSIHLESVRTTHGYNMIPSVCISNGNSTKARILFFPHCMACWSSSPLEPRLQPGSGKSAPFPSSGEGSGDFCTGKWFPSLYETEEKCSVMLHHLHNSELRTGTQNPFIKCWVRGCRDEGLITLVTKGQL